MTSYAPQKFLLVGIGASAGGLDSFKRFLGSIPENPGMAYILVQDLSTPYEGILPENLSRTTDIPVHEITDDCKISPNNIYVIPENWLVEVTDNVLKLTPNQQGAHKMPIGGFLSSLAKVHGKCAVGVLFSGTDRDGTEGLRKIRENGGITMVDDPKFAEWDQMVKSAIEAKVVDFVLPPEEMPAKLANLQAIDKLLSKNEEMQNLTDALETTKEELQSTNEELVEVNCELFDKQEESKDTFEDLNAVIAAMHEPLLILDEDFRIQKANTAYYKRFDVNETGVEGKQFFKILDGQWNHPELVALLKKMLPENKMVSDKELVIDLGIEGEHAFLINARGIVRKDESKKRILLSISDITLRKKTERAYLTTIDQLGRTNEQLDQFVNMASHDLQEPLRKILIFSDLLIRDGECQPEKNLETIKKIASSAKKMSSLIRNMLDYAQLEDPEQLFERTDLNTTMKEIQEDFELLIEQKLAELNIGELPMLNAIPLQINQLFYNLVSNALKFSKKGVGPIISISSRRLRRGEFVEHPSLDSKLAYHEIIVRDNGIGFPTEHQERIFTIFQRLNPSSQYLGSGIGLAICKKIVENHKGKIFVLSKEGQGTAFHVILPTELGASHNRP